MKKALKLTLAVSLLSLGMTAAARAQSDLLVPDDKSSQTHYARQSGGGGWGSTDLTTADALFAYNTGDLRTAFTDFSRLAPQGDAQAQFYLAYMMDTGQGTTKNPYAAISWYQQAAGQDYVPAMVYLGYCYSTGHGVTADDKEAVKWYTRAAQMGNADAQNAVGILLRDKRGYDKPDHDILAAQWFLQAATQRNAHAQSNLAAMYHLGRGVKASDKEALRWYTLAAQQGDLNALTALGVLYRHGDGVEKDPAQAFQYYELAAKKGHTPAELALAQMYESGEAGKIDPTNAAVWYARAAKKGNPEAQTRLGYYYENGYGIPQDVPTAVTWYKKAFEDSNYPPAVLSLAHLYQDGVKGAKPPFPPDLSKAINYYQKCAMSGEPHCQRELGLLYKNGTGVSKDLMQAYQWLSLAAAAFPKDSADQHNAIIQRIQLSNAMTESQLSNARKTVDFWKPVPLAQQSRY